MKLRELTTIEDYRRVYELEHSVWGYTSSEDAVPVPIIIVTQKIGGLLLGAFDTDALVGFAYLLPGVKQGRPFQWSHMLGVAASHRDRGIGWQLKLEQRRLTLGRGFDLIEWTYDPLQAMNAHFNFAKLGVVAREYHENVYGESSSPLHRGTPTDRLIAEWWIGSPHVEERLRRAAPELRGGARTGGTATGETATGETATGGTATGGTPTGETATGETATGGTPVLQLTDAVTVNEVEPSGAWIAPVRHDLSIDAGTLAVTIPTGFTQMQMHDLPLARAWRSCTREIFSTYLPRGYEVVDFVLDRPRCRGTYLLRKP
jgi:predicted GNAT superfamily acetyltransferase